MCIFMPSIPRNIPGTATHKAVSHRNNPGGTIQKKRAEMRANKSKTVVVDTSVQCACDRQYVYIFIVVPYVPRNKFAIVVAHYRPFGGLFL